MVQRAPKLFVAIMGALALVLARPVCGQATAPDDAGTPPAPLPLFTLEIGARAGGGPAHVAGDGGRSGGVTWLQPAAFKGLFWLANGHLGLGGEFGALLLRGEPPDTLLGLAAAHVRWVPSPASTRPFHLALGGGYLFGQTRNVEDIPEMGRWLGAFGPVLSVEVGWRLVATRPVGGEVAIGVQTGSLTSDDMSWAQFNHSYLWALLYLEIALAVDFGP
jgi:hypothetical protein